MSRSDERDGRAWEEDMPSLGERLGLAVRQNPIRGLGIALLLVIALGFVVTAAISFQLGQWLWIVGVGVLIVAVVLGVVVAGTWLSRQ